MKFKDFLTKLKKDGKISQAKFDAAIESAPDWDFDDEAIQAFEESFLTPDRAVTDKRVHSKIKSDVLLPVDTNIKTMLSFIDTVDKFRASEIDKLNSTYEKQQAINAFIPELFEKTKKQGVTDEDTKKKLKTYEDSEKDLLARIDKMNKEYSEKEKFFQTEYEKKISDYQLNTELEKLANSFKFGKAFQDETVRKDITKVKLDGLRSKHALKLVTTETGQPNIQVTDKEGKPLFNGNSAVTISQLLEEEFKPYIKANNTGEDDVAADDSKGQATKRFQVQDDKPKIRSGARTTVS